MKTSAAHTKVTHTIVTHNGHTHKVHTHTHATHTKVAAGEKSVQGLESMQVRGGVGGRAWWVGWRWGEECSAVFREGNLACVLARDAIVEGACVFLGASSACLSGAMPCFSRA